QSGRTASLGRYPLDRAMPDSASLDRAAELLANAERPVVIAGGGVHSSGACAALAQLQETAGLPVATTNMGKGAIDEFHPLSLGPVSNFTGKYSSARFLKSFVQDADAVRLIGNRPNLNGTDPWTLYPTRATFSHIYLDPHV